MMINWILPCLADADFYCILTTLWHLSKSEGGLGDGKPEFKTDGQRRQIAR